MSVSGEIRGSVGAGGEACELRVRVEVAVVYKVCTLVTSKQQTCKK